MIVSFYELTQLFRPRAIKNTKLIWKIMLITFPLFRPTANMQKKLICYHEKTQKFVNKTINKSHDFEISSKSYPVCCPSPCIHDLQNLKWCRLEKNSQVFEFFLSWLHCNCYRIFVILVWPNICKNVLLFQNRKKYSFNTSKYEENTIFCFDCKCGCWL